MRPALATWLLVICSCASTAPPSGTTALGPGTPGPSGAHGAAPRVLAYSVVTVGRHAGEAEIRIEPDGSRAGHFTFNDRGRGPDLRTTLVLDDAGAPRRFHATGHDYLKAPVDERLDDAGSTLTWQSASEHGSAPVGAGWYVALYDNDGGAALARALLRAPGHRIKLLPAGEAWIDDDTTKEIEIAGAKRRLQRIAIAGLGFAPGLTWLDEDHELFAIVSPWTSVIRTGAEAVIPALVADDQAWNAARAARLAGQLAHRPPAAGLAITHARLYDSERRTVVPDATVVVVGDRITAVGDARTPVPAGARVIDAGGKTLIPGLWDMHVHLFDGDGALQLASGITAVRDLGNDIDGLAARVARFDAGTEIGPHVLRAGLIDGPGPFAAPTGVLAGSPEEATAAVQKYADAGYVQIKVYSSVQPALVPVIARAAHDRGLRVSGHIPTGMNAAEAVEAGYDEIQHVNFLFLRFLAGPQDDTRTPLRFTRVAERAADLDLAGAEVQKFLDLLVAHHTVLDPTLATFHAMFASDPSDPDPILVPYEKQLPAQVVRGAHGGGLPAPDGQRAKFRASYAALLRMIKLAWDRKIRIVAGTDAIAGLSLPHELELYVQAGIPPADVLSLATLGAARVMGKDREAGSIAVGKRADLVLIDGDPTRDISSVRNTTAVVCRGVVYDP
ncbi:MAG TPA: amidohydrolase family protein, partial [Kofleriaceae bacterium]